MQLSPHAPFPRSVAMAPVPRARRLGALAVLVAWALVLPVGVNAQQEQAAPSSNADAPGEAAADAAPKSSPAAESNAEPAAGDTTPGGAEDSPGERVDFFSDVWPIFSKHCIGCHGTDKRSGGLRLDAMKYAQAGGDSGAPIVGGTLETNELWRRVSSTDRTYRMPKNAEPLSTAELETLRRWVEQSAVWPPTSAFGSEESTGIQQWLTWFDKMAHRYEFEYAYVWPYTIAFIVVQVAMLVVMRGKRACQKERAWTTGRFGWFARACAGVSGRELTLVWTLALVGVVLALMRGHQLKTDRELDMLRMAHSRESSRWLNTIYGFPPVPIRPDHPKQVAGTYYRGNCERNDKLFNGGNYLTATFRVDLCDQQGREIGVGDPVSKDDVYVRLEIERGPGTTELLFSKELMASVFLSEIFYDESQTDLRDKPVRLETLEEGHRWEARFPLRVPEEASAADGLIYVYTGRIESGRARGDAQYAVGYHLQFSDGKLSAESDVWMGSFGNGAVAMPQPAGKIPFTEWFDYRPIPPITGENTDDPKLLGVDEYVKKKLITPEAQPPADQTEK